MGGCRPRNAMFSRFFDILPYLGGRFGNITAQFNFQEDLRKEILMSHNDQL